MYAGTLLGRKFDKEVLSGADNRHAIEIDTSAEAKQRALVGVAPPPKGAVVTAEDKRVEEVKGQVRNLIDERQEAAAAKMENAKTANVQAGDLAGTIGRLNRETKAMRLRAERKRKTARSRGVVFWNVEDALQAKVDQEQNQAKKKRYSALSYAPPTVAGALRWASEQRVLDGRGAICCKRGQNVMEVIGGGARLYFLVQKVMGVALAIMTVVMLPVLVLCFEGSRVPQYNIDFLGVNNFAIANIGPAETINGTVPFAMMPSYLTMQAAANGTLEPPVLVTQPSQGTWFSAPIDLRQASIVVAILDAVSCAVFLGALAYLKRAIQNMRTGARDQSVTTQRFSVLVKGLPDDVTEEAVRDFFSGLYNLHEADWTYVGSGGCWKCARRQELPADPFGERVLTGSAANCCARSCPCFTWVPANRVSPVIDYSNTNDPGYWGSWVAEVVLARPCLTLLAHNKLVKKFQERLNEMPFLQAHYSDASPARDPLKHSQLKEEEKRLHGQLKELTTVAADIYDPTVTGAFVVFNNEESRRRCVDDFRWSGTEWPWTWFAPPPLRFRWKGKTMSLQVKPAPDPSNVIWENIEIPNMERSIRTGCAWLLVLAVMGVSTIAIQRLMKAEADLNLLIPSSDFCRSTLPATAYQAFDFPADAELSFLPQFDDRCYSNERYFSWLTPDQLAASLFFDEGRADPCLGNCIDPSDTSAVWCVALTGERFETNASAVLNKGGAATIGFVSPQADRVTTGTVSAAPERSAQQHDIGGGTYNQAEFAKCYCPQLLAKEVADKGFIAGSKATGQGAAGDLCNGFVQANAFVQSLSFLSPWVVIVVNGVFESLLAWASTIERVDDADLARTRLMPRIFAIQLINTALLGLFLYGTWPILSTVTPAFLGLFHGPFDSFSAGWILNVGRSIVFAMIFNMFQPHVGPLFHEFVWVPFRRLRVFTASVTTQEKLNKFYEPRAFEPETIYPSILNTVFVIVAFSAGMPLLLPIGAATLLINYWMERWFLLRVFSRPPLLDSKMAFSAISTLEWALWVHMALAFWFYSEPQVLQSYSTLTDMGGLVGGWVSTLVAVLQPFDFVGLTERLWSATGWVPLGLLLLGFLVWLLSPLVVMVLGVECIRDRIPCLKSQSALDWWSKGVDRAPSAFTGPFLRMLLPKTVPEELTDAEKDEGWKHLIDEDRQKAYNVIKGFTARELREDARLLVALAERMDSNPVARAVGKKAAARGKNELGSKQLQAAMRAKRRALRDAQQAVDNYDPDAEDGADFAQLAHVTAAMKAAGRGGVAMDKQKAGAKDRLQRQADLETQRLEATERMMERVGAMIVRPNSQFGIMGTGHGRLAAQPHERKLTWEVIAESNVPSYNILYHPGYSNVATAWVLGEELFPDRKPGEGRVHMAGRFLDDRHPQEIEAEEEQLARLPAGLQPFARRLGLCVVKLDPSEIRPEYALEAEGKGKGSRKGIDMTVAAGDDDADKTGAKHAARMTAALERKLTALGMVPASDRRDSGSSGGSGAEGKDATIAAAGAGESDTDPEAASPAVAAAAAAADDQDLQRHQTGVEVLLGEVEAGRRQALEAMRLASSPWVDRPSPTALLARAKSRHGKGAAPPPPARAKSAMVPATGSLVSRSSPLKRRQKTVLLQRDRLPGMPGAVDSDEEQ